MSRLEDLEEELERLYDSYDSTEIDSVDEINSAYNCDCNELAERLSSELHGSLRAYPNNPAARKAIKPQAKWRKAR